MPEPISAIIPRLDMRGMSIIMYGIPGARKSTVAAALCEYYANVLGKSAYVFGEEDSESYPASERINQINGKKALAIDEEDFLKILDADNIWRFGHDYAPNKRGYFAQNGFSFVVVDSINSFSKTITDANGKEKTIQFTNKELKNLRHKNPNVIFLFVVQVTKDGKARGGNDIKHDCTLEIVCSRSAGEGVATMEKTRVGGQSGSSVAIQEILNFVKNKRY